MMQGDQYLLPIELTTEDGEILDPSYLDELEVFVGSVRKTLRNKEIEFDSGHGAYMVNLLQKDTFMLRGTVLVQARLLFKNSGDVIGVDLGTHTITESRSKVVLE